MSGIGPITGPDPWKSFARTLLDMGPASYFRQGELIGTVGIDQIQTSVGAYINTPTLAQPSLLLGGDSGTGVLYASASSHKMSMTPGVDLTASDFTMLAMVKPAGVTSRGTILGAASGGYELGIISAHLDLRCAAKGDFPQDVADTLVVGTTYLVGVTYKVAGTEYRYYVNAAAGTTGSHSEAYTAGAKTNYIGVAPAEGDYFNGVIQEAALFTRVLNPGEWTVLQKATGR